MIKEKKQSNNQNFFYVGNRRPSLKPFDEVTAWFYRPVGRISISDSVDTLSCIDLQN